MPCGSTLTSMLSAESQQAFQVCVCCSAHLVRASLDPPLDI